MTDFIYKNLPMVLSPDYKWLRFVQFIPGYHNEKTGTYHGLHIKFLSWAQQTRPFVQFWEVNTNWMPKTVQNKWDFLGTSPEFKELDGAYSWALGYHSINKISPDDYRTVDCEYTGGVCWTNQERSQIGQELFKEFCTNGVDKVWEKLEELGWKNLTKREKTND